MDGSTLSPPSTPLPLHAVVAYFCIGTCQFWCFQGRSCEFQSFAAFLSFVVNRGRLNCTQSRRTFAYAHVSFCVFKARLHCKIYRLKVCHSCAQPSNCTQSWLVLHMHMSFYFAYAHVHVHYRRKFFGLTRSIMASDSLKVESESSRRSNILGLFAFECEYQYF